MPVSIEKYLATSYRPDCDYVDGLVLERNVGLRGHSSLMGSTLYWFHSSSRELQLEAFLSLRIQVSKTRVRIPDVCVVKLPVPDEQVFTKPPYICVEVLSPEDTFATLQERLDDYLFMGVPNVWVIDPESQRAWRVVREGHLEVLDGVLRTSDHEVAVPVADLFEDD